MKRILWMLVAVATLAAAQQDKTGFVQKVVEIKQGDPRIITGLLRGGSVDLRWDSSLRVMVLSGRPEAVADAEEAIKKLDVAPKPEPNAELTVYLLSGSSQESVEGSEPPADLASTVKQLRGLFTYKSYRMVESFVLRGRNGSHADTSGILPGSGYPYFFRYNSATVNAGSPASVHIDGMSFSVQIPSGRRDKNGEPGISNIGVNTDLDAQVGQKIVVGKSSINDRNDAMIVVVSAKVIE